MEQNAELPDRCVKSNVPTQRKLKRRLSWHDPMIFLAICAGLLIYVILALILRKTATVYIGLSDEWFAKRKRGIIIGWSIVAIAVGMIVVGFNLPDRSPAAGPLIFFGFITILMGGIIGLLMARMVSPKKITDTHVWLSGCCPEFLEGLPTWDRNRR